MQNSKQKSYACLFEHYENCFKSNGDCAQGVDWPNEKDAALRYDVMMDIIAHDRDSPRERKIKVLDFGCGLAHLYEHIQKQPQLSDQVTYIGSDISNTFVEACRLKYPNLKFTCFDVLQSDVPETVDYVVMNGVFTEKRNLSFDYMFSFMCRVLERTFKFVERGVAFNIMSPAVDYERDDLFHCPLDAIVNFITKVLGTRLFSIRSYGLYENTVYIYKPKKGEGD